MAQFAFNNAVHTTTGETSFYVNYRYHPSITGEKWQNKSTSDKVEKKIKKLKNLHKQLWNDIDFMNLQALVYYNKHHGEGPTLKRGEKVYLLHRNIKIKQPNQKLNHQKIRPFMIKERTGPVNY